MDNWPKLNSPFPSVVERPVLWTEEGKVHDAKKYKAIVDEKTGKLFSIVTKEYKLIRHEEAIEVIEQAIGETPGLGGYEVTMDFYNNGGRMLREYVFQYHQLAIQPGDFVKPTLRLFNSYDLTWPFIIILGAFRLVCTNGLVVSQKFFQMKKRHVFDLQTLHFLEEVSTALRRFSKQSAEWRRWAEVPLSKASYETTLEMMSLGKKGTEEISSRTHQEAAGFDKNSFPLVSLWIFFNILTWYITNRSTSLNHRVAMEGRLRKAIKYFRYR